MISTSSYYERAEVLLKELKKLILRQEIPLTDFLFMETGYKKGSILPSPDNENWKLFHENDTWAGKPDFHAWFYKHIILADDLLNQTVRFDFRTEKTGWPSTNPQFIAYVDGDIVQGLDTNHTYIEVKGKKEFDLHIYAYTAMDIYEKLQFKSNIHVINEKVEKLYYDLIVPFSVLEFLSENSKEYYDILTTVNHALTFVDFDQAGNIEFDKSIDAATDYFEKEFYQHICHTQRTTVTCAGQTHIDVAWLWTIAQAREKAQRSYATVIAYMEKYKDYHFFCSQPVLYKAIKEEAPDLYKKIKEMVKEGRFEADGAMWVEADCNLISGESMVRQFLFGKRFFREEFGIDSRILWLPDVFGYSAAMPQICKMSGVDSFVTSKISWNDTNTLPHDVFEWQGIDGTSLFTYFLTAQQITSNNKRNTTYNAEVSPNYLAGTYERFQDKGLSDDVLLAYGYGDGGGGPTVEQLEYIHRLERGIPGCPNAKISTVSSFLDELKEKTKGHLAKWVGELYLEFHRGTYTAIGKNKKNNRYAEFLLHNLEAVSTMDYLLTGTTYPTQEINALWETVLTLQFHDIIPGSSIKEVYDDSDRMYTEVFEKAESMLKQSFANISKLASDTNIIFNGQPYKTNAPILMNGKYTSVNDVPSYGFITCNDFEETNHVILEEHSLENDYYIIEFNDNYDIIRMYDKENQREILKEGTYGNELIVYDDFSREYEAWEMREFYTEKSYPLHTYERVEQIDLGHKKGIKIVRKYRESTIEQTVFLLNNSPRIDFETEIDWHQENKILKTQFPVDVHADKATFDIQFGNIERPTYRNTSWEAAKFESCAHKYVDISEGDYGVALLNDCKYGYDVLDGHLGLTLLRCPTYPYKDADKGVHSFTYSLCSHKGSLAQSDVVALAFDLNNPIIQYQSESGGNGQISEYSLINCDKNNIVIDTIKKAENENSIIVRLYETHNIRSDVSFNLGFDFESAFVCDLLENNLYQINSDSRTINLKVKPFEIVTLKFNV